LRDRQRRFLFAAHRASAKTEREKTSLTTPDFSAQGGRCQFLCSFVVIPQPDMLSRRKLTELRYSSLSPMFKSLTLPVKRPTVVAVLLIDILYEEPYSAPASIQNVYRRKHEGKED